MAKNKLQERETMKWPFKAYIQMGAYPNFCEPKKGSLLRFLLRIFRTKKELNSFIRRKKGVISNSGLMYGSFTQEVKGRFLGEFNLCLPFLYPDTLAHEASHAAFHVVRAENLDAFYKGGDPDKFEEYVATVTGELTYGLFLAREKLFTKLVKTSSNRGRKTKRSTK